MGSGIVGTLVAAIAVHAVGVNHELEGLAFTLKLVNQLKRILEVNVIVAGAVGKHKHNRCNGCCGLISIGILGRIILNLVNHAGLGLTIGIGKRSLHEALGVMGIVKRPVINAATCNTVVEEV